MHEMRKWVHNKNPYQRQGLFRTQRFSVSLNDLPAVLSGLVAFTAGQAMKDFFVHMVHEAGFAPYSRQYSGLSRSYGRSCRICGSSLLRPTNQARSYHGRRDIV